MSEAREWLTSYRSIDNRACFEKGLAAMTSGGLTKTEGWNLQLQGRVARLEAALREIDRLAARHERGAIGKAQAIARKALRTIKVDLDDL